MTRVTSKLQVTVPKAIADRYGIRPGTELEWLPAGEAIRVVPNGRRERRQLDRARAVELFDRATERILARQAGKVPPAHAERGWRREDLYERGSPR